MRGQRLLRDAKAQYQGLEVQQQGLKIKAFADVKQILPGRHRLREPVRQQDQLRDGVALVPGDDDAFERQDRHAVLAHGLPGPGKGFSINIDHCARITTCWMQLQDAARRKMTAAAHARLDLSFCRDHASSLRY